MKGIKEATTAAGDVKIIIMRECSVSDLSHYYWPIETTLAPLGNLAEQLLAIA